jgi:redox-sensitive bicupin YhaK (pirin superfamily)
MFGVKSQGAFHAPLLRPHDAASVAGPRAAARPMVLLASGRRHGPITRFITPWSIGELTTPFVFLDYAEVKPGSQPLFGIQPHSGIATLTLVLNGEVSFEDPTGGRGEVRTGGVAWMNAAHSVWRGDGSAAGVPLRVFQLWISLPPSQRSSPVTSEAIVPQHMEAEGPVRVILGRFGRAVSRIHGAPADINYFHVRLKDGQRWCYIAPTGHNVTWLAVDRGGLHLQEGERVYWEQIAVFGDSGGVIEAQADGDTSFVLGSARRSTRPLAPGEYPFPASPVPLSEADPEPGRVAPRLRARVR